MHPLANSQRSVCMLTSAVACIAVDDVLEDGAFDGDIPRTPAYGFHTLLQEHSLHISHISLDGTPESVDITRVEIGADDSRVTLKGWSSPW